MPGNPADDEVQSRQGRLWLSGIGRRSKVLERVFFCLYLTYFKTLISIRLFSCCLWKYWDSGFIYKTL